MILEYRACANNARHADCPLRGPPWNRGVFARKVGGALPAHRSYRIPTTSLTPHRSGRHPSADLGQEHPPG